MFVLHNLVLIISLLSGLKYFYINKEYWELRVQVQLAVELELPQYRVLQLVVQTSKLRFHSHCQSMPQLNLVISLMRLKNLKI